jgi:hypothetical protein
MRKSLILLLFASHLAAAAEAPLTLDWSHVVGGAINGIDSFDIDRHGGPDVYALNFGKGRSTAYVFGPDGSFGYDMAISREGAQDSGAEEVVDAVICDIDQNRYLDILLGTELRVSSFNDHRIYRLQRVPLEGLQAERLYNRYVWMQKTDGVITAIRTADVNRDGFDEIVLSTAGGDVDVYDFNGLRLLNATLPGSLWDVTPLATPPVNVSGEPGGNISGSTKFLAGGYQGLHLLDSAGNAIWTQNFGAKVKRTGSAALVSGGDPELIGMTDDYVRSYDLNGSLLWSYASPGMEAMDVLSVNGPADRYLVVSSDAGLTFLDAKGLPKWNLPLNYTAKLVRAVSDKDYIRLLVGSRDGVYSYGIDEGYLQSFVAQDYLAKAAESFVLGEFNTTSHMAAIAVDLFTRLGDAENASASFEIKNRAETAAEGDVIFSAASGMFAKGRYNETVKYAGQAQQKYSAAGYAPGENKSAALAESALEKAAKANRTAAIGEKGGDYYYTRAEKAYIANLYAQAIEEAKKAQEQYEAAGQASGVRMSQSIIEMSQKALESTTTTTIRRTTTTQPKSGQGYGDLIPYGIVLIGVLILAAAVVPRLRKK